jgi:hypothetical protein
VNYNPRKIAVAVGAATALALGACGSQTAPGVQTPTTTQAPSCDLGDIAEGDDDCENPEAYAIAVNKYGVKRVTEAKRKYAEKKAREKARKQIDKVTPATPAPATTPQAKSTRSTSGGGLFGGSKPTKSTKSKSSGFNLFSEKNKGRRR